MGMSDYFIFDNIDTRDYEGILVYFNSVDTTPKRVGEFIEIPNRNGSFFLDGGRYEDVVHTYDIIALSKEHASDLINALASKVGYFRLQDSFNPDEYYSAVLDSEIEPVVTAERDKLTFKIMFTRKPQRWLISGESAVTVDSGDTLTNPTLFESSPLLEVGGSGSIQFNGYEIEFEGVPYGEVVIAERKWISSGLNPSTATITLDTSLLNSGDLIFLEARECRIRAALRTNSGYYFRTIQLDTTPTNVLDTDTQISSDKREAYCYMWPDLGDNFIYGTAKSVTCSARCKYTATSASAYFENVNVTFAYDGADSITVTISRSGSLDSNVIRYNNRIIVPTIYADSSKPNPEPILVDCDLGEAYYIKNGEYISLNPYIDLGSDLPKLGVGSNTVTFDNTITELNITPRWWKV